MEQFEAEMRRHGCPEHWTFQSDGCGGFHNLNTEWAFIAFQAGAALREVEAALPVPNARCKNCDDTGDVHSIDGEWRGRCFCPAGRYAPPSPGVELSDEELPPLPNYYGVMTVGRGPACVIGFTADQMREYARACLSASKAKP